MALSLVSLWAGRHAGEWLVRRDPLEKAAAILVPGGTRLERPLEAGDVYRQGWAPLVVMTDEVHEPAERWADARGLHFPTKIELARDILVKLGVPREAILLLPGENDSTADEGRSLRALAAQRRWRRVIVITSKLHTRRAGSALRRELTGLDIDVRMHTSRYDESDPEHWWTDRGTARFVLLEYEKFLAYRLNLYSGEFRIGRASHRLLNVC